MCKWIVLYGYQLIYYIGKMGEIPSQWYFTHISGFTLPKVTGELVSCK